MSVQKLFVYLHNISGAMAENCRQYCEKGNEQLWPLGDIGGQQMVHVDASLKNVKVNIFL